MKSLSFLSGIVTGFSIAFYPVHPIFNSVVIVSGILYLSATLVDDLL